MFHRRGYVFIETPAFSRRYVYLGGVRFGKTSKKWGRYVYLGGYVYLAPDSIVDAAGKEGSTSQYRCSIDGDSEFRTYFARTSEEFDTIPMICKAPGL